MATTNKPATAEKALIKLTKTMTVTISAGVIYIGTMDTRARNQLDLYAQKGWLTLDHDDRTNSPERLVIYKVPMIMSIHLEIVGAAAIKIH